MARKPPRTKRPVVPAVETAPTSVASSPREAPQPRQPALRVAITGATGTLGRALSERLIGRGDSVVVISRDAARAEELVRGAVKYVPWSGFTIGPWTEALEGCDAVVHLSGAPLFASSGEKSSQQEFYRSRILSTRAVVDGLGALRQKPAVFLSASSVLAYGSAKIDDAPVDERAFPSTDPSTRWVRDWEQAALGAREHEIRTVLLRFGTVLSPRAGTLPLLVRLFERHLGGPILPARAWRPWVHLEDAVKLMLLAISEPRVSGPFNVTAPEPVRSSEFSRQLGATLGRKSWMPLPSALVRRLMGPIAASQLRPTRRVVPTRANELGYGFQFATLAAAYENLVRSLQPEGHRAGELQSQAT